MEYVALYRKYRPISFKEVLGQDIIVNILVNSIKNDKVAHAYLFSGPRGTGKTSVAKIFAKAVNCKNFSDDVCNKCSMCNELSNNDIDIIEIDAASNNGVDEIREIRNNAKLLPNVATYKVYIIDEVHMLSTGAFNALLKTLEEPPHHVIFILATTDPAKIPLTILSRCQRFDFNKISPKLMKESLFNLCKLENKIVSSDVIDAIVEFSDGCMRDAINLLDQILSMSKDDVTLDDLYMINGAIADELVLNLFDCIVHKDIRNALQIVDLLYENGKDFTKVVNKLLILVRNISINNSISDYFEKTLVDTYNNYKFIEINTCVKITNLLNDLIFELKKSVNQKILFEIYLINIIGCFSEQTDEVINNEKEVVKQNTEVVNNKDNNKPRNSKVVNKKKINRSQSIESDFKKIRLNNIFATADKKVLNKMLGEIDRISDFLSNKLYNGVVTLLLQSKLVVASEDYLLFSYKDESNVTLFLEKIDTIERLLQEVYTNKYKVMAVTEKEWLKLRDEYVENIKNNVTYELKSEIEIKKSRKSNFTVTENSAFDLFGEETVSVK